MGLPCDDLRTSCVPPNAWLPRDHRNQQDHVSGRHSSGVSEAPDDPCANCRVYVGDMHRRCWLPTDIEYVGC